MDALIVTGGAGFIGSSFVRHLLRETTDRVVVLDKLTYAGSLANLDEVENDSRYRFVRGDIGNRELIRRLLEEHRPWAVVNLAAETHVDRSIDAPRDFLESNVLGAYELLDACRAHFEQLTDRERERFRVLHVSTDEVYGSLGSTGLFTEQTAYAPNSPYAASKAAADHFVRAYHETYRLPTLLTNCSNNYGPRQFPEKLIPLMILNLLEARDLPIYGDGGNVRDWLFVEDHCAGLLLTLRRGQPGRSYNIGGGNERTNLQIVDTLCRLIEQLAPAADNPRMAERGRRNYSELKVFVPDRKGHDRRYAIDAARIHSELGWQPQHDFDLGLQATVQWYLQNREWCDRVQQQGGYQRERLGLGERQ